MSDPSVHFITQTQTISSEPTPIKKVRSNVEELTAVVKDMRDNVVDNHNADAIKCKAKSDADVTAEQARLWWKKILPSTKTTKQAAKKGVVPIKAYLRRNRGGTRLTNKNIAAKLPTVPTVQETADHKAALVLFFEELGKRNVSPTI